MERGVEVAGWKKYKRRLRAKRAEWVEHRHLIGRMTGQEGLGGRRGKDDTPKNEAEEGKRRLHDRRKS